MQKRHAAAAAIFIVLSIVMTWPLAPRVTHAVTDPTDPFINIWILDWDHYATFHHPLTLFDANIFHPAHDTLALSENLYGLALPLIPFRLLGASAVTAYNIAMLAGFAFSGFAAYLLGVRLTGSFVAGIAAGVFHAFVPFRFTHLPHVQHVFAGWVPLLLVALLDYVDLPSWRTASLFAFVFLMNGLTNIHWLLFGSFAIGATILLFLAIGVRRWRELFIASAVAGALLMPFLIPYWHVAEVPGMVRDWSETKWYSAVWSDWLVAGDVNRMLHGAARRRGLRRAQTLSRRPVDRCRTLCAFDRPALRPRYRPRLSVADHRGPRVTRAELVLPSVSLRRHAGIRAIRVPARWAEIAYVGLATLIAVTTAFIARRRRWVAAIIPLLFVLELWSAPIRWYRAPLDVPEVDRWLATQNVRAVVELPIDIAGSEYLYVFRAVAHHRPLINGASGAVPAQFVRFSGLWKSDPIPDEFDDELRRAGCELVIVHANMLGPHDATTRAWLRRELDRGRLSFMRRFPAATTGDWVFHVERPGMAHGSASAAALEDVALEAFVDGKPVINPWTFGYFDQPPGSVRGSRFFSDFAFSPYGVRGVDLIFDDGRVRVPTTLIHDEKLLPIFPFYGASTPRPRFVVSLARRPDGLSIDTDVQAEIIDGRGVRQRLQFYWIRWE